MDKFREHRPISDINVTPLVDVMLVLLVLFIVAAPIATGRLNLELPRAVTPSVNLSAPGTPVRISLNASGQAYWEEEPVDASSLYQRLQQVAQRVPSAEIQLRADTNVSYGQVLQIIAQAQAVGLSRIGFVADRATVAAEGVASR